MTGRMITKSDFMELMMGVLTAKINSRVCCCSNCPDHHVAEELTADEIFFIQTVADNVYMFAVADGMGRAFEAMKWVEAK